MQIERSVFGGAVHMVGGGFTTEGRAAYETNFHRPTIARKDPQPRLSDTALVGFATVYSRCHYGAGQRVEAFMPGAFSASLRTRRDVAFLKNHSWARCYGSTTTGELELFEDDDGLAFKLTLGADADGQELLAEVKAGRLQMSVGYTAEIVDAKDIDGTQVRLIRQASLGEISAVHRPAVKETSITVMPASSVKSLADVCRSGRMKTLVAYGHFERRLALLQQAIGTMG